MRRPSRATLLALAFSGWIGCSRTCSEPAPLVDAAPADVVPEVAVKTSRCKEDGPLLRIAAEDQPVEIGSGALGGTQAAIGMTVGGRSKLVLYRDGATRTPDLGAA